MTAALRLEAASLSHTGVLVALYGQCFEVAWSGDSMASVLASPGAFALLAVTESQGGPLPVAFAIARHAADEVEVISLGVLPAYRRRGVAARLLEEVIARAVQGGALRVVLEVAETNDAARALYLAYGFLAVGRRPDYYQRANTVPVAALTMARDLARERVGGG